MSGFRVEGASSANVAEVDANHNLFVVQPQSDSQAGYGLCSYLVDSGSLRASVRTIRYPYVSAEARLGVGLDTPVANYVFDSTTQNTALWKHLTSTMTASQSGGFLLLNANSTATTTTGCSMQSWQYFPLWIDGGLQARFIGQITVALVANQKILFGLFVPTSATADPTEGAWFSLTSAGLVGNIAYNGSVTSTSVFSSPSVATSHTWDIVVGNRQVEFWQDGALLGLLSVPAGNGTPFMMESQPASVQQYNTGTVVGTQAQTKFSAVAITQLDVNIARPFSTILSNMGQSGYQGQEGGTVGTTAAYTNNQAAGTGAALLNTAALITGLGGQAAILPTLTAGTDGIVCSFQNPVGTVNQPSRTLLVKGIRIQGGVTTVLAGGPVLYAYSVAFGHTSVSMATTESGSFTNNTAKAPRRIPLGYETYAATAAVGATGAGVYIQFDCPIAVHPAEFFAICAKNLGVVTTSGVITLLVTIDSVFA